MKALPKNRWMLLVNAVMVVYSMVKVVEYAKLIYSSFSVSAGFSCTEFLINYQGGFVRRGLLGQGLYWLATNAHVYAGYVIGSIVLVSALLVLLFLVRQVVRHDICWWIIPLNFTFCGADVFRKDYLCMLFVVTIVCLLAKDTMNRWVRYVLIAFASMLLWNIHEAFFFVIGPFMTYYMVFRDKAFHSFAARVTMQLPIWGMFLLLLHYHGDVETAVAVQGSWHELYPQDIPAISGEDCSFWAKARNSITALGWDTKVTIGSHLHAVYGEGFGHKGPFQPKGIFVMPILYLVVFYFVSRYIYVFAGKRSCFMGKSSNAFALLFVFLFCSMLPLFGGLSCDTSRLFMYWTLTAMSILFIFGQEKVERLFPVRMIRYSGRVNSMIDRFVPSTPLLMVLIFLFVGAPRWHYTIQHLAYGVLVQIGSAVHLLFQAILG